MNYYNFVFCYFHDYHYTVFHWNMRQLYKVMQHDPSFANSSFEIGIMKFKFQDYIVVCIMRVLSLSNNKRTVMGLEEEINSLM